MKLSELSTGDHGVIVKVNGHGGFRKRIVEMGFIKGELVEVVLNAPLRDPVKYRIMDYEVSLRRAEADLIEVAGEPEAAALLAEETCRGIDADAVSEQERHDRMRRLAEERGREITVAFVGNPNCGKTSIFNLASGAHERVGNYSGVTVDAVEGRMEMDGYTLRVIDLPGTYSLSTYSPEELYVRKYIIEQTPSVIVNVVDASNLERNLYLTAQLIDMDIPMIMALNMYDELRASGRTLDVAQLGRLLGVPCVPTVGRTGEGIKEVFRQIIDMHEDRHPISRHIHINHGRVLERHIAAVEALVRVNPEPHFNYSGRFLAIKLLERDRQVEAIARQFDNAGALFAQVERSRRETREELHADCESAITDAKYGFVRGALHECLAGKARRVRQLTQALDTIVTHPAAGYPLFVAMMFLMFFTTFFLGQFPMNWIDALVGLVGQGVSALLPAGALRDLLVDGIISGVGGVIVFLPQIMILYGFISWMEDSGYMSRAAFIMDKMMHRMGLHGKSFIPMIMGFGCNIPAIMATRSIEDRKSRLVTMLIIPFMSCSARLPVYIIIIGAFFQRHAALVLTLLYLGGIGVSVVMAHLISRFVVKGESDPFVMELPPYRLPSTRSVLLHTWEKGRQYIHKMGTTILLASIVVWALAYFPRASDPDASRREQAEQSYIGRLGRFVSPALRPCGMDWKESVSVIAGVGAKEIVASTMGVLYSSDSELEALEDESGNNDGQTRLSRILTRSSMTPLAAAAFLAFILLYMPCVPACVAIRHESGSWRWSLFTIIYTTATAWVVSTLIFQIGRLFG